MTVATQVKQTIVSLKGAQATMRLYEEHCRNEDTRLAFHEAMETVTEIVNALEGRQRELEFQEPQYQGL